MELSKQQLEQAVIAMRVIEASKNLTLTEYELSYLTMEQKGLYLQTKLKMSEFAEYLTKDLPKTTT